MDIRQSPLILGFSLGRYYGVSVRISIWFVGLILILCLRLGAVLGIWTSLLLFVSILIHEFAHVFGARQTGGQGDEILMWPLGGLAFVAPAANFRSEFWTTAAGPLANLLLCLISLPAVIAAGTFWDCLHPIMLPPLELSMQNPGTAIESVFVLLFALNLKLLVLNLLPIYPLDGGQIAFSIAKLHYDRNTARIGSLYVGMVLCILLTLIALFAESNSAAIVTLVLLTFGMQAHLREVFAQQFGSLGLDYGPGDEDEYGLFTEEATPQLSMMERWRLKREEKRRAREVQQQVETAQKVDALLEKINLQGFDSLTESEKKFLQQASSKYKTQRD